MPYMAFLMSLESGQNCRSGRISQMLHARYGWHNFHQNGKKQDRLDAPLFDCPGPGLFLSAVPRIPNV